MPFLSRDTVGKYILENKLILNGDLDQLTHSAYELKLGNEYYISEKYQTKQFLDPNSQLVVPPGQMAILISKEVVHIPKNILGFISLRSKYKLRGLINISGFHVDPGFCGKLKFSVYNVSNNPIILQEGLPIFSIWFARLDMNTSQSYHSNSSNNRLTEEDVNRVVGTLPSPVWLKREIERLKIHMAVLITLFMALLIAVFSGIFDKRDYHKTDFGTTSTEKVASPDTSHTLVESQNENQK